MAELTAPMLSATRHGYEVANQFCTEAQQLVLNAQRDFKHIRELNPKLGFLRKEWGTQSQYFKTIKAGLQQQHERLDIFTKEKRDQLEAVDRGLAQTLVVLQGRQIEPELRPRQAADNHVDTKSRPESPASVSSRHVDGGDRASQTIPAETLYSLVDDKGLQHEVNAAVAQANQVLVDVDLETFEVYGDLSFDQQHVQAQLAKQSQEQDRMLEDLESIANHHGQIQLVADDPGLLTPENWAVLERDTEEIDVILGELQEGLNLIRAIAEEMQIRTRQYEAFFRDVKRGLRHVFKMCIPAVHAAFSALARYLPASTAPATSALRASHGQPSAKPAVSSPSPSSVAVDATPSTAPLPGLELRTDVLLAECANLNAWYIEFARSYDHLLVEIDRRCRSQYQHARLAEEFAAHLTTLYQAETTERDAFTRSFGQYLPIDLCAALMPPAPQYRVEALAPPVDLPDIADHALQVAKQNIALGSTTASEMDHYIPSLEL